MEIIFLKKVMCLPHVSSMFKKISPKTYGPKCIVYLSIRYRYVVSNEERVVKLQNGRSVSIFSVKQSKWRRCACRLPSQYVSEGTQETHEISARTTNFRNRYLSNFTNIQIAKQEKQSQYRP
jgi:hypothetical protein